MPEAHVVSVSGPRPVGVLGVVDAHDHLFLDSPAMPGQAFTDPDRAIAEAREGKATGIGDDRRDDADRARAAAGRDARRGRCDRPDGHRRVGLPPRRPLPGRPLGPRRDRRDARRPDRDRPHRGHAPVRLERSGAPARPGARRRHQGRRLVPPDHAQRAAPPRGHRRGRRPRPAPPSSSTRRSGRRATTSSTSSRPPACRPTGSRSPTWTATRTPSCTREIAARGVTLEYDTIGRIKYRPDSILLDLIEAMVADDWTDSIVLGLDLGARDYLRAYDGGPGMRYLMQTFVPRLRSRVGDKRRPSGSSSATRRACTRSRARGRRERSLRRRRRRRRVGRLVGGDHRRAARGADPAPRPARVHGRHVDRRPRHVLRVLHAGHEPAARRRRPRLGGRGPADRGRRRLRAAEHVRRRHRRHLRRRGAQGALGAAGRGRGRRAAAAHVGDRRAARTTTVAWRPSGCGTRAASDGSRRPRSSTPRATRTSRAMAGAAYDDASTHARRRPVALDAVQARQRGHRAGDGRPQGRAVGADARRGRERRLPAAAGRGLVAPDAVPGRRPDPHDADPERGRDRPGAAHPRRGRGPPAGAGVPPLPARPRAGLRAVA